MSRAKSEIPDHTMIDDLKRVYGIAGKISKRFYLRHGDFSERQIRNNFGTFNEALDRAGLVGKVPSKDAPTVEKTAALPESQEFAGDTWTISKVSRINTLPALLEYFEVDTDIWEVTNWKANKWEMAGFPKTIGSSKNWSRTSTAAIITPLYQVKATFAKKKVMAFAKLELASLKERFKEDKLRPTPKLIHRISRTKSGNILELNIPDLHAGKLAWSKETGYKDYDTKIALDVYDEAIDHILADTAHIQIDQIVYITGNDMMHSDTLGGTTTSGTQLDNDSRYHKVFVKLRNRVIDIIKYKLLPVAPVKVISCPGNHDKLTAWHLADSIEMYFHDDPNVEVDNSPKEFKFHQHGQVMLMFCHGNTGKKPDYPLTMATREKEMWGSTTYREAHTGHVHQTMVQEFHGVRVRVLPALCEPDAWHANNNFVGNLRTAEGYVWNADKGLISMAFYNAD